MSSPHGSLLCSHWKCVAVVSEVNRIECFRCHWKNLAAETIKMCFLNSIFVIFSFYLFDIVLIWSIFVCFYPLMSYSLFLFFNVFCHCSLDRHVQSHHGHHKPFKCKFCPFKSAYLSRLKSHLHKAHTGKNWQTQTYIRSHLTAVSMTNKVSSDSNDNPLFTISLHKDAEKKEAFWLWLDGACESLLEGSRKAELGCNWDACQERWLKLLTIRWSRELIGPFSLSQINRTVP